MDFREFEVEYQLNSSERFTIKSPIILDGIIFIENEALGKKWLIHPSILSLSSLAAAVSLSENDNKNIRMAAEEKRNYHDGYLGLDIEDDEELLKEAIKSNPEIGNYISNDILFSIGTIHPNDNTIGFIFRKTLLKLCDYGRELIDESVANYEDAPWLYREEPIFSIPFDSATGYFSKDSVISNLEKNMILELGDKLDEFLSVNKKSIEGLYQMIQNESHPLYQEFKKLGLLSAKEKSQKLYYLQSWDKWELEQKGSSPFHNLRLLYILSFFQEEIKAQQKAKEEEERLKLEEANRPKPEPNYDFNTNIKSPIYYYEPGDKEKKYPLINERYLKGLDNSVKELYEIKNKIKSDATEDLKVTASAKRRFLLDELVACGLTQESQYEEKVNTIIHRLEILGLEYLKDYYKNIGSLLFYITSEARKEYCPEYFPEFENMYGVICDWAESGSLLKSQISLEWFGDPKNRPEGYDPNVWLAKCECLFKNSSYKDKPGILFSKIDNRRVKIVIEYDDGINLRMVSAELMA